MQEQRETQALCKRKLSIEHAALHVGRRKVESIIVEATLADSNHLALVRCDALSECIHVGLRASMECLNL